MPKKYRIQTETAPPRFAPIGKSTVLDWEGGCLHCFKCVKRSCIYDAYNKRTFDVTQLTDTINTLCKNCLRCVQSCPGQVITKIINPEYKAMGDSYWTPDIIARQWYQAETGSIPVSGAGYPGPFSGPGFDDMWTDMSEIVRPTRDGIHGREYINTSVSLGRKPSAFTFDDDGKPIFDAPKNIEIPIPMIFGELPFGGLSKDVYVAMAGAAMRLNTLIEIPAGTWDTDLEPYAKHVVPVLTAEQIETYGDLLEKAQVVEIRDSGELDVDFKKLKEKLPDMVAMMMIKTALNENSRERVEALSRAGADIIHIHADRNGNVQGKNESRFIKDTLREVHDHLVNMGIRENVTLIASGGIAMAEHVAKGIICGADAVAVDIPLLLALECRVCLRCEKGLACPVEIENIHPAWGKTRIMNLIAAWRNQILEVLGAMGIREIKRLRGEVGRAMFFRDLEAQTFGRIFGLKIDIAAKRRKMHKSAEKNNTAALPEVRPMPSRFRNAIGKYRLRRSSACVACGTCAEVCPYGVHIKRHNKMVKPKDYVCIGPKCNKCIEECPEKALSMEKNPLTEVIGDRRWTPDLLISTWYMAETGEVPPGDIEYKIGDSGGGFDSLRFHFIKKAGTKLDATRFFTKIPLNRRNDGRADVEIGIPVYGGGMSYGSISLTTMVARARAWKAWNSFTCTGEGGYPEELYPYDDHVITQVATGLFGVREETIQRVRIIEFKYAQGAKPGLGGHLLGDKVTADVARMREAVPGSSLFSPFPFHSVYSVEDHKKHVDWIKEMNPKALVSVKVSTPTDVDMVAVGSYYAGAHIIHLDGSYGGTGAAPEIAKKNIAMPIEYGIVKVHNFLKQEGIRNQITVIASGGIRTAYDIAKAIALGADGVVIGTAELVALECIRCSKCESGRGCARGIATTDPELSKLLEVNWATQRLINLFAAWRTQLIKILQRLGMRDIRELVGRTDCLRHLSHSGS